MRKLSIFVFISIDGYYKDIDNSMQWHQHGQEEGEFSAESMKHDNMLLFGRITYQMMAGFWPTQQAMQSLPETAIGMNKAEKIVFSNTLKTADWQNTTVISGDIVAQVTKLKQTPGKNMTILGSGTILTQLAQAGLIDEYLIMIDPIALGAGTPIFKDISEHVKLKLTDSRAFKSGTVLLSYAKP